MPITTNPPGTWAGQMYQKYIASTPAVEAGVLGTAGGLVGHYGGGLLLNNVLSGMLSGKSPAEQQQIMEELQADGTLDQLRTGMTVGGAGIGAAYGAGKGLDTQHGLAGAAKSIFTPNYWQKHPEYAQQQAGNRLQRVLSLPYRPQESAFQSGRQPADMPKFASAEAFDGSRIPVSYSLQLLAADPVLNASQKAVTSMLVSDASNGQDSGEVSEKDLTRSAIQAGVGYGTAYLFGRTLGGLLSLPPDVTRRISRLGGIGGAVLNTGILEKLL